MIERMESAVIERMESAVLKVALRSLRVFRGIRSWCFILLLAGLAHRPVAAQVLSLTPGQVSAVTSLTGSIDPTYSGPVSGLTVNNGQTLTFDHAGNLYFLDSGARTVRVLASGKGPIPALPSVASPTAGSVYTVAGSGAILASSTPLCATDQRSAGDNNYYGNGCPATDALLSVIVDQYVPAASIALDAAGNLYITDTYHSQIRVVYAGGTVPGLPSNLTPGYIYGFAGIAGSSGNSGNGGSALAAQIYYPTGIAVDPFGNVYMADSASNVVRVVYGGANLPPGLPSNTVAGGIDQITPAGSGPVWSNPSSVASDAFGNIYVSDLVSRQVYVFYVAGTVPGVPDPLPGFVYLFAGSGQQNSFGPYGGPATAVSIFRPSQVSFDSVGNAYLVDYGQGYGAPGYIDKIDPSGTVTLLVGDQSGTNCAASVDSYGDGCTASSTAPPGPVGIAIAPNGNLYYTDSALLHVLDISTSSISFSAFAGTTSDTQVLEVANVGGNDLQITGIQVTGPFAQVAIGGASECSAPISLAPGRNCLLGVSFTPTSVGSFTGTIAIASNSTNATNGSNTITLSGTAAIGSSSIALTVSPPLANVGQPVTILAAISPAGAAVSPTGTVNFLNGATSLGTASVSGNTASLVVSTLPAGSYSLTATYSGDSNYSASTSYPATLVISSKQVPSVALTASASSATVGQTVTFTASVTPSSGTTQPTGTVTFSDGSNPLGSAPLNGSGATTFSTSALPAGANTIYAVYSGDANFAAATSLGSPVQVQGNALLVLQPGVISTVAGNFGVSGYSGDGGPATGSGATLYQPFAVSVDPSGNVYIADGNYVRVVAAVTGTVLGVKTTAGNIYTVAGNGNSCNNNNGILDCGDGGPATSASLQSPSGVSADAFGNLYIMDNNSAALVRKVNSSGIISTVAGSLNTNVTPTNLGDGGPATNASLSGGGGIRTDNRGNLYIADEINRLIRRVDAETGIITTVAGTGTRGYSGDGGIATAAQLSFVSDLALDASGNLFIADTFNHVIRRVDAQTGNITTVAGTGARGFGGDGGPALNALLWGPSGVEVDGAGNLYIADTSNDIVRRVDVSTGIITTIAGVPGVTGTSGDGGLATNANLSRPEAVALDRMGNLLIVDTNDYVVREVTGPSSAASFGSQSLGSTTTQTFTVSSVGSQALNLTAINFPNGFTQQASGGTDCSAPMTLNPGQSCELAIGFFPTDSVSFSGTVTIASNSGNATSGVNSIAVSGSGVANSGTTPQTITFTPPATATYGQQIPLNATASSGLPVTFLVSGPGRLAGNTLTVTGTGPITVTAYQFGDSTYAKATQVQATINANAVQLTVTADSLSRAPGSPNPTLTYTVTGFVNGDTQATALTGAPVLSTTATQSSPTGVYPITIQQGTLQTVTPNYTLTAASFVNGTLTVTAGLSQAITFPAIPNANSLVYGTSPITLQATTSAPGLQVIYTVQGNAKITGSVLSITGAGPVAVTATQPGDATYAAASPVTQSFTVAAAPLTFTADNLTMAQGAAVPPLTYTVSGLVNGDTAASVVSGSPKLSTTANSSTPVGTVVPITITQGSLALSTTNYVLTPASFVNGTLTVVTGSSQTINFGALPNTVYGVAPFALNATASSGLPVTFSVTGPATVTNSLLTVNGAGTVTVTATQSGNGTYTAAPPVQQSFTVAPAPLTVTANNATRLNDTPNPNFTYTISGFVNGDTSGVVGGAPSFSTTATPGSPTGTYPINVSIGSLTAANYTFANFIAGTLTITTGGPAPDFSMTLGPQQMTIVAGQVQQTTIAVNPVNYYQGLLNLSCKGLPANVSCVFTPAALTVATYTDSNGNPIPVRGTLTITTGGVTVVSSLAGPDREIRTAAVIGWSALLFGAVFGWRRKRLARYSSLWAIAVAAVVFGASLGVAACGGKSSSPGNNGLAASGTSTIQVVATDSNGGPSHSLDLVLTVR